MDFDQGQFNFDAKGPEDGYRKWREELETKKREFEARHGVILGRRVSVTLRDHWKPLTGTLEWITNPKKPMPDHPTFRLQGVDFTMAQVESMVREDD